MDTKVILLKTVSIGDTLRIRLKVEGEIRVLTGKLNELGTDYLVLSSAEGIEFVGYTEVIGFGVADGGAGPGREAVDEKASQPEEAPPSTEPLKALEIASPEPTAQPHVAPIDVASPGLVAPAPDFGRVRSGAALEVKNSIDRAQSVYNYALKIGEVDRLRPQVKLLRNAAFDCESPIVYLLAAEIAILVGDLPLAREIYEDALEFGVTPAYEGLAYIADESRQYSDAATSLVMLLTAADSGLPDERWSELAGSLCQALEPLDPDQRHAFYQPMDLPESSESRSDAWNGMFPVPDGAAAPSDRRVPVPEESAGGTRGEHPSDVGKSGDPQARAAPIKNRIGRVDRVWEAQGYGFVVAGTPVGKQSALFRFDDILDVNLRRAIELGWRGEVKFDQQLEVTDKGKSQIARNLTATSPISLSSPRRLPSVSSKANAPAAPVQATKRSTLREAKRKELDGDLNTAADLYVRIIASGSQEKPTAIKELAWLKNRMGDWETAVALLDDNITAFAPNDRAVGNLRLNILLKGKQFERARRQIHELRKAAKDREDLILRKHDIYCLIGLGELEKAQRVIEGAIGQYPGDASLALLRDRILEYDRVEVDLTSLQNIGAGLTDFSIFYLDTASLVGADERSKARGYFDADDFKWTYRSFDQIQGHRPHDRANVMLTLAHMCWRDPLVAGDYELSDLLRRFFSLMAESRAALGADPDCIRTFAVEAIALCHPDHVSRELPALFDTYLGRTFGSSQERLKASSDAFLANGAAWEGFLRDLPVYESRSPQIRKSVESFAASCSPRLPMDISSGAADAVRQCKLDQKAMIEQLQSDVPFTASRLQGIEDILVERSRDAPIPMDGRRLKELAECVVYAERFASERDFSERQAAHDRARASLIQFMEQVVERPTLLGLVPLRAFAKKLLEHVDSAQAAFLAAAKSVVKVSDVLAGESYTIDTDGLIRLTFEVEVLAGGPPIEDAVVTIDEKSDVEVIEAPKHIQVLQAERLSEVRFRLRPSVDQIREGAFDLYGTVSYTSLGDKDHVDFNVPVRMEAGQEFSDIPNPYSAYAGGTIVEDPRMFYGRESLLDQIMAQVVDGQIGQCFVLYGQKRSGKSSVLEQLHQRMRPPVLPVKVTVGEVDPRGANYSFLHVCAAETIEAMRDNGIEPSANSYGDERSLESFKSFLRSALRDLARAWPDRPRIVLLVDEFTYVYGYIQEQLVDSSFMRQWKALMESKLLSAVVVGQDSMPRFKQAFPNEFGVTHDKRLSYLSQESAVALARDPILLDGRSRFRGRSLDRLLHYSASSPWYLQIMCDRLVLRLNREKAALVTESDVEAVAKDLVSGQGRLGLEVFNPLISAAGATEDLFPLEDYLEVLRQVAWHTTPRHGASADDLRLEGSTARLGAVIEDLVARDVLRVTEGGMHRVVVGLFEYWLRVNRPVVARTGSGK